MARQLSWPDGRTLLRHVAPCLDGCDEPPGVVVTYLDVSLQRELEERLRKSEANFRLLFADSPDAYLIMAIDGGTVLNCNRAAEVMLRGTREQIIGATPDQLSPEFQPDGRTSAESVPEKIIVGLEKGYNRFA